MVEINKDKTINCFNKILDKNSKILILGTKPGGKSLQDGYYYANSENFFWEIINKAYKIKAPIDKNEFWTITKKQLLKNKIGVWDVLESCKTKNNSSKDEDIYDEVVNDFNDLNNYPNLQKIIFNGKTAYDFFIKQYPNFKRVKTIKMLSTSPLIKTFLGRKKIDVNSYIDHWVKTIKH